MRSTDYALPVRCSAVIGWFFSSCDWCISIPAVSVCCSFGGPLSYGSAVVVFLDREHPYFRNFYSTIPVDVVRVRSFVNRLTINKLYFVPKRAVAVYQRSYRRRCTNRATETRGRPQPCGPHDTNTCSDR